MTAHSPGPTASDIVWLASVALNVAGLCAVVALGHWRKAEKAFASFTVIVESAGWAGWL